MSHRFPKCGDIVLVKEDLPRGCWNMGKVMELIISADGHVRSTWQSKAIKDAYFSFCWHFEYIILHLLILFLDMCPNSYGWVPSL